MAEPSNVAVLVCSYNRRDLTLRLMRTLLGGARLTRDCSLHVFLVDASSTDGTRECVEANFPDVTVIRTPNTVYWGGGMARAAEAAGDRFDYFLWLNDDVELYAGAIAAILETARSNPSCLIVGATLDSRGCQSYGGLRTRRYRWQLAPVELGKEADCDTMNGNIVLVPKQCQLFLGGVDPIFPHAMGDLDYGFRARGQGFRIIQHARPLGLCDRNPPTTVGRNAFKRLKEEANIKRLPPRAWWVLWWRHSRTLAPIIFAKPYLSALKPRRRPKKTWEQ